MLFIYLFIDAWLTAVAGCISRLLINGVELEFAADSLRLVEVTDCPSCRDRPCRHGGTCQSATSKTGYKCHCAEGYSGLNCELIGTSCRPGKSRYVLLSASRLRGLSIQQDIGWKATRRIRWGMPTMPKNRSSAIAEVAARTTLHKSNYRFRGPLF